MRKIIKSIFFVLICIAVFAGSTAGGAFLASKYLTSQIYGYLKVAWNDDVGTIISDLPYGDKPLNNYDLYLPSDGSKDNYSLIYFIHGGGFSGGDKAGEDARLYGKYFASKGYIMASANYTLAGGEASADINTMHEELITALSEIDKQCDELGYHVNEMAITGTSAGGCLALLVALKNSDILPVPVKFVFEETGPASFDPELWSYTEDGAKAYFINMMTGREFGLEDVESDEYWKAVDEISPAAYVNESTCPILLAYGANDKIVPPAAKYPLLEALKKFHVPHDYIEFYHSGHGMLGDPDQKLTYYHLMEEYMDQYFTNK